MSVLETLTEGIKERSLQQEGAALIDKWSKTGLLEGLGSDYHKNNMSRLLENQAAQLLKEASSMAGGDVQGFASVAFPIVRRVFGGLIANDLVSVQPMSLPSGLIFFLDFTYGNSRLGDNQFVKGESLFGGGVVGAQITGGARLGGVNAEKSFYALNNGYASPTGSATTLPTIFCLLSGTVGGTDASAQANNLPSFPTTSADGETTYASAQVLFDALVGDDPDLSGSAVGIFTIYTGSTVMDNFQQDDLITVNLGPTSQRQVRRLSKLNPITDNAYLFFTEATGSKSGNPGAEGGALPDDAVMGLVDIGATGGGQSKVLATCEYVLADNFTTVSGVPGAVVGDLLDLEGAGALGATINANANADIPEIDIKVDSVAVTATTKKLKAKWTPELGQDLQAYHNLDAEVELTQVLSEMIALEIDQEILEDLVVDAAAGTYYWSRSPGKFVNRLTGQEIGATTAAPDFTGNVSEWYETLVETINDVSAQIHRKTLRGGANFIVVGPEVANILEFTAGFRANVTGDTDRGTVGAVKTGSLSKKWDVYVDPYFPRNIVLVGRKGGSFLESGYVYAPYVPLQVTPTIFGQEDFVPRKGVMTRYAKKMVRADMYGLVIVTDLIGQSS